METQETLTRDNNKQVYHQVERVNLSDYGYEKSGNVKGDPDIFQSYLKRIMNGDLVEENYKGLPDDVRVEKRSELTRVEKILAEAEFGNGKFQKEISDKKKKIDEYRQKLLDLREKRNSDPGKTKKENFSTFKFTINLFILLMLSGYLFFFYVSAAYKALYVDFEAIAENIAQGMGTGSIMPGPYELGEALSYNFLLFLVPFVFYAFGWAFHIILELNHKAKFVFLGMLIAVTFTVDLLLAMIIHTNTELAKELMGLRTLHWSQSSTFYIILFLGFLVYIVWSILFDSMLREWDKGQIPRNINRIVAHLEKDIKLLASKMVSTKEIKEKIQMLREEIGTVMFGNLKRYIDQFSTGWLSYLSPENMKAVKERCLHIKKDFEEKNGIKPGIVKVVSRREQA